MSPSAPLNEGVSVRSGAEFTGKDTLERIGCQEGYLRFWGYRV